MTSGLWNPSEFALACSGGLGHSHRSPHVWLRIIHQLLIVIIVIHQINSRLTQCLSRYAILIERLISNGLAQASFFQTCDWLDQLTNMAIAIRQFRSPSPIPIIPLPSFLLTSSSIEVGPMRPYIKVRVVRHHFSTTPEFIAQVRPSLRFPLFLTLSFPYLPFSPTSHSNSIL